MNKHKKFSERLGVKEDASTRTIKAMFQGLAGVLHPDKLGRTESAKAEYEQLTEAYHYLLENRPKRPSLETKRAAILAADVTGYCRMMAKNEKRTLEFLFRCRHVFEELVKEHAGRIFNTAGDAILCEFSNASIAVRCALEIQSELSKLNSAKPEGQKMLFRVGINFGNVFVQDGDLLGDTVNLAARLQTSAEPRGVLISGDVYELINHGLPCSAVFEGEKTFKGISRPIRTFSIVMATAESEPTAVKNYTKKTSYMIGDLEKTLALPKMVAIGEDVPSEKIVATPKSSPVTPRPSAAPRSVSVVEASSLFGKIRSSIPKWGASTVLTGFMALAALGVYFGDASEDRPNAHRESSEAIPATKPESHQRVITKINSNTEETDSRSIASSQQSTTGSASDATFGLGFRASFRTESEGRASYFFVEDILPDGAAGEDGRLRVGDKISAVLDASDSWASTSKWGAIPNEFIPSGSAQRVIGLRLARAGGNEDVFITQKAISTDFIRADLQKACELGDGEACAELVSGALGLDALDPETFERYTMKACALNHPGFCPEYGRVTLAPTPDVAKLMYLYRRGLWY